MAKLSYSFCDLDIVEATILVVAFAARSVLVLRTCYGFVYINVCLSVPEFLLDKNPNNSNEVKKNYHIELFK